MRKDKDRSANADIACICRKDCRRKIFCDGSSIHHRHSTFALSPLVLSIYGKVALSEAYVALFGYWLYGLSCIAVGLFISSISESVIISAILTFAALFLSYMMQSITGLISSSGNLLTKVLNCFDLYTPFENFVSGCFSVTSAAYYVTVICFYAFLRRSLSRREDGHFQRR